MIDLETLAVYVQRNSTTLNTFQLVSVQADSLLVNGGVGFLGISCEDLDSVGEVFEEGSAGGCRAIQRSSIADPSEGGKRPGG